MKIFTVVFVAALLFLSSPQARAAGPGGVERVGALDLGMNLTPINPLSVLYLQRAQLLAQQMSLNVELKADQQSLDNVVGWIVNTGRSENKPAEAIVSVLRKAAPWQEYYGLGQEYTKHARTLVASIDSKRFAIDQLKTMLESVNAEIEAMKKDACSCSKNPSSPGGATAKGPCSC